MTTTPNEEKILCSVCGGDEFRWEMQGCNERGWRCMGAEYDKETCTYTACPGKPGEPEGFCPQLDRSDTAGKVHDILSFMHENEILYVSNGTMGEGMTFAVMQWCRENEVYDQSSIIVRLFGAADLERHARFWQKIGQGVVSGNDPRDRCDHEGCNKLATVYSQKKNWCHEHHGDSWGRELDDAEDHS